jgi:hypothetical protein
MHLTRKRALDQHQDSTTKKPKLVTRSPRKPRPTEDEKRLEQVFIIFEGALSMYFIDGREPPTIVPELMVYSCELLDTVIFKGGTKKPSYRHLAAACIWIMCQFHSDEIGCFGIDTFIMAFRRVDHTITARTLANAQRWILKVVDFDLWAGPTKTNRVFLLERDDDLASRSLVELGFLAEQCFYPPSMVINTFYEAETVQAFIDSKKSKDGSIPSYRDMQCRFRAFCENPKLFQGQFFAWTLEPQNKQPTVV